MAPLKHGKDPCPDRPDKQQIVQLHQFTSRRLVRNCSGEAGTRGGFIHVFKNHQPRSQLSDGESAKPSGRRLGAELRSGAEAPNGVWRVSPPEQASATITTPKSCTADGKCTSTNPLLNRLDDH